MKIIKFHLFKLMPAIVFIFFSYLSFGQNILNGLWKSTYVTSYSDSTSGIQYTRILLNIEDSTVTLKNFDGIFKEKEIFSNSGIINQEKNMLIFNQGADNERTYPLTIEKDYLKFNLHENPKEEITLKKLVSTNLGDKKANLNDILIHHFISGDFTYYNESLGIEFSADSTMLVTSSLKTYLSILNNWVLVDFGAEMFLVLSDYGPMVHITNFTENQFDFSDEYDNTYNGSFHFTQDVVKFDNTQLIGIWEQENPDTTGLSNIPAVMYDKEFYIKEVWEFDNRKAIKHAKFFTRESQWKTSRNGEILLMKSMEDRRFRILTLDEDKLVVERMNMYGEVFEDTFLRKKSVPKPTTLGKYFK